MSRVNARWKRERQFRRNVHRNWVVRDGKLAPPPGWHISLQIIMTEFHRETMRLAMLGSTSTA